MINLVIVDDHPMVITGLVNMLRPSAHLNIMATYPNGNALLQGLKSLMPDVLLLDMNLPDTTANELIRTIKKQYPKLSILIITSMDNPFHVRNMLQSGCLGYLLKSASPETVIAAIEQVHRGEEFLESSLQRELLDYILHSGKARHVQLTKREQEILEMICEGLNNYEIADKLFLSHRTIENHRMSIYLKLDVKNTAGLVRIALQQGLIR